MEKDEEIVGECIKSLAYLIVTNTKKYTVHKGVIESLILLTGNAQNWVKTWAFSALSTIAAHCTKNKEIYDYISDNLFMTIK